MDYLEEQKWIKDITKAHHSIGSSSQTGNLEHTTQPTGSTTAGKGPLKVAQSTFLPGILIDFGFFQGTWLILAAVLQFGPSENDFQLYLWEGRSLVNPISFRKFLKLFRVAYFLSEGSALWGGTFQYHNKLLNNRYETLEERKWWVGDAGIRNYDAKLLNEHLEYLGNK